MPSWSTRRADPFTGSCRAQRPLRSEPRSRPSRSPSSARRPTSRTSSAASFWARRRTNRRPAIAGSKTPRWHDNPFLRRAVQTYLAAGESLQRLLEIAELDQRDELRMRFLADNLHDAAAPSNLPWLNPAALKEVVNTGGANIVRGLRNLVGDMAVAPRVPSMVAKEEFSVGEDLAVTPGAVVLRTRGVRADPVHADHRARSARLRCCSSPRRSTSSTSSTWPPAAAWSNTSSARGSRCSSCPGAIPTWQRRTGGSTRTWRPCSGARRHQGDLPGRPGAALRRLLGRHHLGAGGGIPRRHRSPGGARRPHPRGHRPRPVRRRAGGSHDGPRPRGGGGRAVDPDGVPRRPLAGRGVRVAAAERSHLELLGQQLPAREEAAGVRHPLLERRHDPHAGRPPPRLPRDRLENKLVTAGAATALGVPVDLSQVTVDAYVVGGVADHITPWQNCYRTTQLLGGTTRFVLSTSGHIAALVNPTDECEVELPDRQGQPCRSSGLGELRRHAAGQLVGRLRGAGSATAPRRSSRRPSSRAVGGSRRSRPPPAPTSSTSDRLLRTEF